MLAPAPLSAAGGRHGGPARLPPQAGADGGGQCGGTGSPGLWGQGQPLTGGHHAVRQAHAVVSASLGHPGQESVQYASRRAQNTGNKILANFSR